MTRLKKGEHWATINPDQLAHEQKLYELEKDDFALKIDALKDAEIENLLSIEKSLNGITQKIDSLTNALTIPDLSKEVKDRISFGIEKLKKQQLRLRKKIDSETYLKETALQKRELELSLDHKKRSLQDLKHRSELKAEFSGDLELLLPSEKISELETQKVIWLKANHAYARIVDRSSLTATLTPPSSILYELDPKRISLQIPFGTQGRIARASFEAQKIENIPHKQGVQWLFKLSEDTPSSITNTLDTPMLANLFYELNKPAHIVPKRELISTAPDTLRKEGWHGLIKKIWPETKIVTIGPQSIAIQVIK
ncbi:hypothetical protein ACFPK9_07020 [Rubritalea spongiae]